VTEGSSKRAGDEIEKKSAKRQRIMDTTKAQQINLDDALVAPTNHLKIGKCNHQLSSDLKSNEPTIQVVLDTLKFTPFYNAFQITSNVLEIYMQEFWATVSTHHHLLWFKMNGRSHTLNVENFKDMLHIYPILPGQRFEDPPLEEEIISFIGDLGHTREIKVMTDVNVNYMHQPWRSFDAIINRAEPPKAKIKYKKKADESVTSPKSKTTSASKGTRLKSKAKVDKPDKKKQLTKKTKAKGLVILSKVALTEAEQIKLVTKRSKTDFHISQASGLGDGVDTQSKVSDEQVQKTSDQTEYKEEKDVDKGVQAPADDEFTDKEKLDDEETMDDEEDD
nr:hypothetical protein [Tanacetum cinerariifolium]